jgi:hypothetical protein
VVIEWWIGLARGLCRQGHGGLGLNLARAAEPGIQSVRQQVLFEVPGEVPRATGRTRLAEE